MNAPGDPIIIKHVRPESAGWMRVHGCPRLWERPDGTLYQFSPRENEILVVCTRGKPETLIARMHRVAGDYGLQAELRAWLNKGRT